MISPASRPYIDASVPVLREHGLAITQTFYRNLFVAHPELSNLFNMGNQANGAQQQSLASAVFAYAANIDNTDALYPVVNRIVHKHASVGITAEHYPIVGRHLIGAIQETLGDAASPPLLAAWDEAYRSLANLFIEAEKKLYAHAGVAAGQLHNMRVTEVSKESEEVTSFTMQAADGQPVPGFKPGQYVSVSVEFDDNSRQLRQYSLSNAPNADFLRISVKRERAGEESPEGQVSNWIHDNVASGTILRITHPFGEFIPDTESIEPIVLISAGVGITPMISVLNRIAEVHPSRFVIFAHAARDEQYHSHQADINAAKALMPNLQTVTFYESASDIAANDGSIHEGMMDVSRLPKWPRSEANVYMCGPFGFMKAQWLGLVESGVPVARLHREVFGPEMLDYLN
ncbi:MAG: NO-inducible flavohemoprotein [Oxalobacteraceae bacterium]|nr:NO-inducible flavohemoprotein [Oxalobacteraceae bacterium]